MTAMASSDLLPLLLFGPLVAALLIFAMPADARTAWRLEALHVLSIVFVLVTGTIRTSLAESCSRCLRPVALPLEASLEEEVLPSVDVASGLPVAAAPEDDELLENAEADDARGKIAEYPLPERLLARGVVHAQRRRGAP